jgi:hypothetical protein
VGTGEWFKFTLILSIKPLIQSPRLKKKPEKITKELN